MIAPHESLTVGSSGRLLSRDSRTPSGIPRKTERASGTLRTETACETCQSRICHAPVVGGRYRNDMTRVDVDSVEGWTDVCSTAFVPLRVRTATPRFAANLDQLVLAPGVSVTRVSSAASEVYRSRQVIMQNPREDLIVSLHRSGAGSVFQNDREVRLRAGVAAMYDSSTPYTLAFPGRMREIVLQLPRRSLSRIRHSFADLTARALPDTASTRAMIAVAMSVNHRAPERNPIDDLGLAEALTSLLLGVVTAVGDAGPPRLDDALLVVVLRGHIATHSADPALTPESLSHAYNVSLRLAQRVFAETGDSIAACLRRQRLAHAHRLLLSGSGVRQASYACGYRDVDSFSRAFAKQYGYRPVDATTQLVSQPSIRTFSQTARPTPEGAASA